ncbi:hypothetical protein EIZ39_15005 [Ammoniphilus sp. CFH 90114]|nr:hypothetical protein EIZ39_15005 [Ammoniphilus sp. CFH 90114]
MNQHALQEINEVRQGLQAIIRQTQQSNAMYQQMLHQEQQNAIMCEQLAQREHQAVQTIQMALQGHQTALQQFQHMMNLCNHLEQDIRAMANQTMQTQMMNPVSSIPYRQ